MTYCIVAYAVNQTNPGWHIHTKSQAKADAWERKALQVFVSAFGCQALQLRKEGQYVPAAS